MRVYEPAEDSQLMLRVLQKYLQEKSNLKILEMGIGSGFVASNLSDHRIFGADINEYAVEESNKKGVQTIQSDLFDNVSEKYDLIYFNPPYLPQDKVSEKLPIDSALYGGDKGYEITHNFLHQLNPFLEENGVCFLLLCNISKPNLSLELIENLGYNYELMEETFAFPEKLFVYKLTKSELLKKANSMKIKNFKHLAKGKKGRVYAGTNESGIKIKFKISLQPGINIMNEVQMLERLKSEDFVMKLIEGHSNYFIQELAPGKLISEWLVDANKESLKVVFEKILTICRRLDLLQIDKKEMTNPYKHIIIDEKLNVKFIDFERSSLSETPKNITQIVNYFTSSNTEKKLITYGVKLDKKMLNELAAQYKENYEKKYFDLILNYIRSKFL